MLRTALSRCARQVLSQAAHGRQATALATLAACQPALLGQAASVRGAAHAHAAPRLAAPLARSFAAEPARLMDEPEPHHATPDLGTPAAEVCEHKCGACAGCGASSAAAAPSAPTSGGQTYDAGYIAPHAGIQQAAGAATDGDYLLMHPVYTREYVESVAPRHRVPTKLHEHIGFRAIQVLRGTFDVATGYGPNSMTEAKWLQRMIFLETVAGVPGMVAGMLRHMKSLRSMTRDNGWIHTLLEEAENERMHLLTFLKIRQPGFLFRTMVLLGQGVFFNFYVLAYILSPKTCHSMVGYLEEEAVKTYTHALHEIDAGKLWANTPAPDIAIKYWRLPEGATMRDLILAVRADEAAHSHVNHTFSAMKPADTNPFAVGQHAVP